MERESKRPRYAPRNPETDWWFRTSPVGEMPLERLTELAFSRVCLGTKDFQTSKLWNTVISQ